MKLPIKQIRLDGETQTRARIHEDIVNEYSEEMRAGAPFPPLVVFHDGINYWLADGFHRWAAATALGLEEVECDVRQGMLRDAQWHSYSANQTNGMRRTNADKTRAVQAALRHSPHLSNNEIARHVGVSSGMVATYRPDRATAAVSSVGPAGAVGAPSTMASRVVTRNGKPYVMNTAAIGRTKGCAPRTVKPTMPALRQVAYNIRLPLNNPPAAARALWMQCPADYLVSMVRELSNLLKDCPSSSTVTGGAQ